MKIAETQTSSAATADRCMLCGEELGDEYLYFITGATEETLLNVAFDVAALPGTPHGVFAVVTDDEAEEMDVGRRMPLR